MLGVRVNPLKRPTDGLSYHIGYHRADEWHLTDATLVAGITMPMFAVAEFFTVRISTSERAWQNDDKPCAALVR